MTDRQTRDFSVVICVYTEDRWEDILAAVASVRHQSRPALETLLVVDHNPALLERLGGEYKKCAADGEVRVLANAGPRGLSAGRNTGIAAARARTWPSWTTTPWPSATGCGTSTRGTPTPG